LVYIQSQGAGARGRERRFVRCSWPFPEADDLSDGFEWRDPGVMVDGDLELVLGMMVPADPARDYAPCYQFEMRRCGTRNIMGRLSLRVGHSVSLEMYAGHIGYNVLPEFRGRRYAARSCLLVLPFAFELGIDPVWITVNPDNWPSRRTCELIGAEYVDTVALPEDCEMYRRGERYKCRYRVRKEAAQYSAADLHR
jgi:predicted acetyltransferase